MEESLSQILIELGAVAIALFIILFAVFSNWTSLLPRKLNDPLIDKLYIPIQIVFSDNALTARYSCEQTWLSQIYDNRATLNLPSGILSGSVSELEIEFLSGGSRVLRKRAKVTIGAFKKHSKISKYDSCEIFWAESHGESEEKYITLKSLHLELATGDV